LDTDCTFINYKDTNSFSELVYDYIDNAKTLQPFYQFTADKKGIEEAIDARKNRAVNRPVLVEVLQEQYASTDAPDAVLANIQLLLHPNTYTICTAHQPNLLTGYLYFFYKILHAIKMAEVLKTEHPELNFVPVYYMGSEDNDLEELGQFWHQGQKYTWDAAGQTGAVGRMNTKSLALVLEKLFAYFGPPGKYCSALIETLSAAYLKQTTIAAATQYLVNSLFGHHGLVVLNPDNKKLKRLFAPIIMDELLHQKAYPIVHKQSALLAQNYTVQAFPRPINLFYLKDDMRARIEKQADKWVVLQSPIAFSEKEIIDEVNQHPDRFSPNVILRGLFQETILPNICFIGGGSELAYWLQLKPLFDHYNIFYPSLFLRQSVQIISPKSQELLQQTGFSVKDIFDTENNLIKRMLLQKKGPSWDLSAEAQSIESNFVELAARAKHLDASLEKAAAASITKIKKQLKNLEQKMYRAEKKKEATSIDQIIRLKSACQPNGIVQERIENFSGYYLQYGWRIFDEIKSHIRPFENQFMIISTPQ
jgi:bacillithiol synthase